MNRRRFLQTSMAAGLATALPLPAATKRSATDLVPLGNSGVKVSRLALGTGTFGGKVQRSITQDEFNRVVRHAYDRGVRFFETADSYKEMPQRLAIALKGIPRDSYKLMTKMRWRNETDPQGTIERFRKDLNTDYFDILLIHCVRQPGWSNELERMRDAFSEAKQKKVILAHGASAHGILPVRDFPGNKWVDVALLRINHDGTRMDTLGVESEKLRGDVPEVTQHIHAVRKQGTGVIGMKLIGEGAFRSPEQREKAFNYVFGLGSVDSVTVGFKSTQEVDEAMARIDTALNRRT